MMRSRIPLLFLLAMPAIAAHAGDAGYVPKPDEPEPNKDYDRRLTEDGEIDHDCGGID